MINFFKIGIIVLVLISCKEKKDVENMYSIESPAKVDSKQPYLFANGDQLVMSWTQKINDSMFALSYSELNENKWTKPVEIVTGDNWFVNWADFPAIAKNNDNLLVHFLQKSDSKTFAYDVRLMLSNTNGDTWSNDFLLHSDSTKTEHGFVTLLPYKGDSFFVTWLDGRNTGGGSHGDEHSSGAMNIRAAVVQPTGQIIDNTLVDAKTCDCCQTSAAITSKGPIIVYRDRTDEEVRDIYISRLLDGSWTIPKPIHNDNWVIDGCPVNGPKAASYENTLAVAWFTAANNKPKVKLSFSNDSGASFDIPIQIGNGKPIGRVDVALLDEDNALVSWMESTKDAAKIKVMKVNSNGEKHEPVVISTISAARASGFPQIEIVNDIVYIAWNNILDNQSNIKIKNIPISNFD
jgi:hypothetical protein